MTKTFLHPVDKYCGRPQELSHITFTTYFKEYRISHTKLTTFKLVGKDTMGNYVYELPTPAIIRFTDYHPAYNLEGYCYNLLLSKVPFRSEVELLQAGDGQSYVLECIQRNIICTQEDLEGHIDDYTTRHLYTGEKLHLLLAELQRRLPPGAHELLGAMDFDAGDDSDSDNHHPTIQQCNDMSDAAVAAANQKLTTIMNEPWFTELDTASPELTHSQQACFDQITSAPAGLFVLQGGPGTGKTFLTQCIAHYHISQGKQVMLAASTGAAAVRFSRAATTVHTAFAIPVRGCYLTPLDSSDIRFHAIKESDIIFIDEFSMVTSEILNFILQRLQSIMQCNSVEELLTKKTIVLVGDPNQLPPVCTRSQHARIRNANNNVCTVCRINAAPAWSLATKLTLTVNVRHSADRKLAKFLQRVQTNADAPNCGINQKHINRTFASCTTTMQQALQLLTPDHQVICTHHVDAHTYNDAALHKFFKPEQIQHVDIHTNASQVEELQPWLQSSGKGSAPFHKLTALAVGARVMLTSNIDLPAGAANGAIGTVEEWTTNRKAEINMIKVRLHATHTIVKVRRTDFDNCYHNNKKYYRSTFPLTLAYAITGHSSQGMTLRCPTILHFNNTFVPGLAYVMLSRVTSRSLMHIVGHLTPESFQPLPAL